MLTVKTPYGYGASAPDERVLKVLGGLHPTARPEEGGFAHEDNAADARLGDPMALRREHMPRARSNKPSAHRKNALSNPVYSDEWSTIA
jgi:hypothetical protein